MNTNKILSSFFFLGSSVKKLNISNNFVNEPTSTRTKKNVDVEYEVHSIEENSDEKITTGLVTLYVNVKLTEGKTKSTIKLIIDGCFGANSDAPIDDFKELLSLNGCATLYSIARSLVLTTSAQVFNTGSISLPMISIFELRKAQGASE